MNHSSDNQDPIAFIITAAGSSKRMGTGPKKEFRDIGGQSPLFLTLKTFLATSLFSYGLITCKSGTQHMVESLLRDYEKQIGKIKIPVSLCDGGAERQHSVHLGLQALSVHHPRLLKSGYVLIHDGARPWVDAEIINLVVEKSIQHNACAPVTPSIDAMKEINETGIITGHLPRKETVSVQTPQGFAFNEILSAHNRAAADGRSYIDDTEIFSRYEGDVYTVPGNIKNRKITYVEDLTENFIFGDEI